VAEKKVNTKPRTEKSFKKYGIKAAKMMFNTFPY